MKWSVILILTIAVIGAFRASGQSVTYRGGGVPVIDVLGTIRSQTGFFIFYRLEDLADLKPVTVNWLRTPLRSALNELFTNTRLSFSITHKTVIISKKPIESREGLNSSAVVHYLQGAVVDSSGAPLGGATVSCKGSSHGTLTNERGMFLLKMTSHHDTLAVSFTGYTSKNYPVRGDSTPPIVLQRSIDPLDETVVIAYGSVTKRLNPGSVVTVGSADIERQPVGDVLQALTSDVPGLEIVQQSGMGAGGYQTIRIRGVNSLNSGSSPLFLVDGVEVPGSNDLESGSNPFIGISPGDIESVSVLKDADATAIYGSRGANGVILLTTKKGKPGSGRVTADLSSGINTSAHAMKLLNTRQYLTMRHEAFANDGETPNAQNAPDLTGYGVGSNVDRFTNWQHALIGQVGNTEDARLNFSGGSPSTYLMIGATLHRETPTSPGRFDFSRPSAHFNLRHTSSDRRLGVSITGTYSNGTINFTNVDITALTPLLPPNLPSQYKPDGTFNFISGLFPNPYATLAQTQQTVNKDLIASATLSYRLLPGLELRSTFGYSGLHKTILGLNPLSTLDTSLGYTSGNSFFSHLNVSNWQIEPQIEYTREIGKGKFTALFGSAWQHTTTNEKSIYATGFPSDAFLRNYSAASDVAIYPNDADYKYMGAFTRLNYTYRQRYLVNLTGRRDGSSRFGPGRQFGNFGAVGAGWIFSEAAAIRKNFEWLGFGKLRASYGITGNDQIGDYQYLDTYAPIYGYANTAQPYQGLNYDSLPALSPSRLFNSKYSWETTRKLDLGLDLELYHARVLLYVDWYRHRSTSQLLDYSLPPTTGFFGIFTNYPAVIGNQGWEFLLKTVNIKNTEFAWCTELNLTVPRNRLIAFPDLAATPYNNVLVIGQPLSTQKGYKYLGVDPQTGIYQFAGNSGKPTSTPTPVVDQTALSNTDRRYYAGLSNVFQYRSLQLVIDLQYVRQKSYDIRVVAQPPGTIENFPAQVLSRWQKPGDRTNIEQFTQDPGSAAYQAVGYATGSTRAYIDGSWLRVKNLALSYKLPPKMQARIHSKEARIYLNAQNLLTFTHYVGNDPETGGVGDLPPLRTLVTGIQCSF